MSSAPKRSSIPVTPAPEKASIILASASPRRRQLLRDAGWRVTVDPAAVSERRRPGETPAAMVRRLARAKAAAVAARRGPDEIVLGADTTVVVNGHILAKPAGDAAARAMLRRLAGRRHQVLTGVCLRRGRRELCRVVATTVWFAPLTPDQIRAYVATGEPRDKAGAYAIQGRAACFIPRIAGSYSNVVGLPLDTVAQLWRVLHSLPE